MGLTPSCLQNGRLADAHLPANLPDFLARDQEVRLVPELDFGRLTVVPAVADNAVLARRLAGQHARLNRTCDGGQDRPQCSQRTLGREGLEARGVREQRAIQPDNKNDRGGVRHAQVPRILRGPQTVNRKQMTAAKANCGRPSSVRK